MAHLLSMPRLRKKADIEASGMYQRDALGPPKGKGSAYTHTRNGKMRDRNPVKE